jgi:hypothetical protein
MKRERTSLTPIAVFTPREIASAPTVTMPVAIMNAFPAYAAVLKSALDMAETSSPTLGESSVDGALIDADSDETDPRCLPICATVVLPTRRGGGADDSWREFRSATLRCLIMSTSGIARAIVVPANCF